MENIIFAWYHSIYNKGLYDIKTLCKVDLHTNEVFDIEGTKLPCHINSLDEEFVEMIDGTKKEVVIHKEDMKDGRLLLGF